MKILNSDNRVWKMVASKTVQIGPDTSLNHAIDLQLEQYWHQIKACGGCVCCLNAVKFSHIFGTQLHASNGTWIGPRTAWNGLWNVVVLLLNWVGSVSWLRLSQLSFSTRLWLDPSSVGPVWLSLWLDPSSVGPVWLSWTGRVQPLNPGLAD